MDVNALFNASSFKYMELMAWFLFLLFFLDILSHQRRRDNSQDCRVLSPQDRE